MQTEKRVIRENLKGHGGNFGVKKKIEKKGRQKESFELTTRLAWWGIEHRRHGWIRIKGLSVCVCVCVCVCAYGNGRPAVRNQQLVSDSVLSRVALQTNSLTFYKNTKKGVCVCFYFLLELGLYCYPVGQTNRYTVLCVSLLYYVHVVIMPR